MSQKKLLNINGYAKFALKEYKGPLLSENECKPLQLTYSKEKTQFTTLLHDTLKSLLASETNLKKNIDSNMGFLYGIQYFVTEIHTNFHIIIFPLQMRYACSTPSEIRILSMQIQTKRKSQYFSAIHCIVNQIIYTILSFSAWKR